MTSTALQARGARTRPCRAAAAPAATTTGPTASAAGSSTHYLDTFGRVRALVFGHFGEFNDGLLGLAKDISVSISHQHHRKLGFKSKQSGLARAKAGVMRRLSMTALRSTARQVLRGLAIVGPTCIHQRNAREAAYRAHLDAFGADRGAPWRDPTNGG